MKCKNAKEAYEMLMNRCDISYYIGDHNAKLITDACCSQPTKTAAKKSPAKKSTD